jgi:hypothetical protein
MARKPGSHGNLGNGFKGRARTGRRMRSRDKGYIGSERKLSPIRAASFGQRGWR